MTRAIAVFHFLLALFWVLGLAWIFLALAAMSTPVSAFGVVFYWGGLLVGPLLLMGGSIVLIVSRRPSRAARLVSLLGAGALAGVSLVWVGPSMFEMLRKGDYGFGFILGFVIGASMFSGLTTYTQWVGLRRSRQHADGVS